MEEEVLQKSAREIKVTDIMSENKDVKITIGTVENRNNPSTIYISFSFWLKPDISLINSEQDYLKKLLEHELNSVYKNEVKSFLKDNYFFPYKHDNIFIITIPDNLNYNSKKNYVSFELYLHTLNIESEKQYPLNHKKDTELFFESLRVAKLFSSSDFLMSKKRFKINKTSR